MWLPLYDASGVEAGQCSQRGGRGCHRRWAESGGACLWKGGGAASAARTPICLPFLGNLGSGWSGQSGDGCWIWFRGVCLYGDYNSENYYSGRKLRFSAGVGFLARGLLAIPGGILGHHNWRGCSWHLGAEGRDAAKPATAHRTASTTKNYPARVNGAEVEKPDIQL